MRGPNKPPVPRLPISRGFFVAISDSTSPGYDQDGSALTRSQVAAIVEEAREINGAERKDKALAGTVDRL